MKVESEKVKSKEDNASTDISNEQTVEGTETNLYSDLSRSADNGEAQDNSQESENNPYLSLSIQRKMEKSFNQDFSQINIYKNSKSAEKMNARAYAKGNDLHFAEGEFDENTRKGQELLGHELAHVVQQRQGRVESREIMSKGVFGNANNLLETEADDWGAKAAVGDEIGLNRYPNTSSNSDVIQKKGITDPEEPTNVNGDIVLRIDADGNQLEKELELTFRVRPVAGNVSDNPTSPPMRGNVQILVRSADDRAMPLQEVMNFDIPNVTDFSIDSQIPVKGVYAYRIHFNQLNLTLQVSLNLQEKAGIKKIGKNTNYAFQLFATDGNSAESPQNEVLGQIFNASIPTASIERSDFIELRSSVDGINKSEMTLKKTEGVSKNAFYIFSKPYGDLYEVTLNKHATDPGVVEWVAEALYSDESLGAEANSYKSFVFYAKHMIPVPYTGNEDTTWFDEIELINTGQHIELRNLSNSEPFAYFFMSNSPEYHGAEDDTYYPGNEIRNVQLYDYVPTATENNGLKIHEEKKSKLLNHSGGVQITATGKEGEDHDHLMPISKMATLQQVRVMARIHAKDSIGGQRSETTLRQESGVVLMNLVRLIKQASGDGFIPSVEYQLYHELAKLLVSHDSVLQRGLELGTNNTTGSQTKLAEHLTQHAPIYAEIEKTFEALINNENKFFLTKQTDSETIESINGDKSTYGILNDILTYRAGEKLKVEYDKKLSEEKEDGKGYFTNYYSTASKELDEALKDRKEFLQFVEKINYDDSNSQITEFHTVQSIFYSGPVNYDRENVHGVPGRIIAFKELDVNGGCTWHVISQMNGKFHRQSKYYSEDVELKSEVFKLLDDKDFAQEGILIYQVPSIGFHGEVEMTSPTENYERASYGALALSGVGLICTITGVGAPVGAFFFALGGVVQAGSSIAKYYDNKHESGSMSYWDLAYALVDTAVAIGGFGTALSLVAKGASGAAAKAVRVMQMVDPVSGVTSYALMTLESVTSISKKYEEGDTQGMFMEIAFLVATGGIGFYGVREHVKDFKSLKEGKEFAMNKFNFFEALKTPKGAKSLNDPDLIEILDFQNEFNLKPEDLIGFYNRKTDRQIAVGASNILGPKEELLRLKKRLNELDEVELKEWLKSSVKRDGIDVSVAEKLEVLDTYKGGFKAASVEVDNMIEMQRLEDKFRKGGLAFSMGDFKIRYHFLVKKNKNRLEEVGEMIQGEKSHLVTLENRHKSLLSSNKEYNLFFEQENKLGNLKIDIQTHLIQAGASADEAKNIERILGEMKTQKDLRKNAIAKLDKTEQGKLKDASPFDELMDVTVPASNNMELSNELKQSIRSLNNADPKTTENLTTAIEEFTELDRIISVKGQKHLTNQVSDGVILEDLISAQKRKIEVNEFLKEFNSSLEKRLTGMRDKVYGGGFDNIKEMSGVQIDKVTMETATRLTKLFNKFKVPASIAKADYILIKKNLRTNMITAYKDFITKTLPLIIRTIINDEMNHKFSTEDKNKFDWDSDFVSKTLTPTEILEYAAHYGLKLSTSERALLEDLQAVEATDDYNGAKN